MALTPKLLQQGSAGGGPKNYIEDVFSTYLYSGSASTQTVTNNINLSGKGGLVWIKSRNDALNNILFDTTRGDFEISSSTTAAQADNSRFFVPLSTGFSLGGGENVTNNTPNTYVSWTFREQPKFFDVVTYTGNGANRTIAHNLGSAPGCIIIKRTDAIEDWNVYHRSLAITQYLNLGLTAGALTGATRWNSTTPTDTVFSLGTSTGVNASGGTYIAYLFAHDAGGFGLTGTDNVISCGSATGDPATYLATVDLGYEPQWVLTKSTASAGNWTIIDNMRGMTVLGSTDARLFPNSSSSESSTNAIGITSTGFITETYGDAFIYIAIRRGPMKVPTSGTSVFAPALGTSASTIPTFVTNFPVDLGFYHSRANTADWFLSSRLQGGGTLNTNTTLAEAAPDANYAFDSNTGWGKNFNSDKASSNFRRAPSFFDEVCYTGNSVQNRQVTHNLTVKPDLVIVKKRNAAKQAYVYNSVNGATGFLRLFTATGGDSAIQTSTIPWNDVEPTSTYISLNSDDAVNGSGDTYVAYLFSTCAGVSKVGSYTGTATTKQIDCGFTGGARFVLIKRTDSTGDWYVWDTARGIVSGNDSYLLLNSTAAEVTNTDYIDTYSAGFEISSTAPAAINASGGSFIFLAIA